MKASSRNVGQLGAAFFLVFAAFSACSSIQSVIIANVAENGSINPKAGFVSLAILYAFFTGCNLFVPPIIHAIGPRWALAAGATTYVIFELGFLFLNEPFLYCSSALIGFGAAIIWTAQGTYLSLNSSPEDIQSHSGFFWAAAHCCQSVGGIFVFFVFNSGVASLSITTIRILFGIFAGVTSCGVVLLATLPTATQTKDALKKQSVTTVLDGRTANGKESYWNVMKSTIHLAAEKPMLVFAATSAFSGIELSFWSGIYPACIGFTLQLDENPKRIVGLNGIVMGLGQAAGGILFGIVAHRFKWINRQRIVFIGMLAQIIVFIVAFINFPSEAPLRPTWHHGYIQPSVALAMLCSFLLGFGDACWNSQMTAFLISRYSRRSSAAFSLNKFYQHLMTCTSFIYATILPLEWQLALLAVGAVIGCWCFWLAEKLAEEETTQKEIPANYGLESID